MFENLESDCRNVENNLGQSLFAIAFPKDVPLQKNVAAASELTDLGSNLIQLAILTDFKEERNSEKQQAIKVRYSEQLTSCMNSPEVPDADKLPSVSDTIKASQKVWMDKIIAQVKSARDAGSSSTSIAIDRNMTLPVQWNISAVSGWTGSVNTASAGVGNDKIWQPIIQTLKDKGYGVEYKIWGQHSGREYSIGPNIDRNLFSREDWNGKDGQAAYFVKLGLRISWK